jgi:hypothetical protein
MPKYLIEASYTLEGLKGIMKSGGTARRTAHSCKCRGSGSPPLVYRPA